MNVIIKIISSPWFYVVLGLFMMIIPPCVAASKNLLSLEPGFSYGAWYGAGLCFVVFNFPDLFCKKKD